MAAGTVSLEGKCADAMGRGKNSHTRIFSSDKRRLDGPRVTASDKDGHCGQNVSFSAGIRGPRHVIMEFLCRIHEGILWKGPEGALSDAKGPSTLLSATHATGMY